MFEGDTGIEHGHFDSTAFSFLPQGWDAEEFESPVDRLGRSQHYLLYLEGGQPIDGPAHAAMPAGNGSEVGLDPTHRAARSGGSPISHKTGKSSQIKANLAECRLCLAIFGSFMVSLSI